MTDSDPITERMNAVFQPDAGEALFRKWSGNSYEWGALSDVERQRWNRLTVSQADLLRDALAELDWICGKATMGYLRNDVDFLRDLLMDISDRCRPILDRSTGGAKDE